VTNGGYAPIVERNGLQYNADLFVIVVADLEEWRENNE